MHIIIAIEPTTYKLPYLFSTRIRYIMRNVILFIAMSLDGYIADRQGGVEWLCGEDANAEMPDTYGTFVRDIDTVVMGWNTYHQIVTELSPNDWIYRGM